MPSEFVLGPFIDGVIEPEPASADAGAVLLGRRGIAFLDPPTLPGGRARLRLLPFVDPSDKTPANVYAFFVQPLESIPSGDALTADWFFKSGAPSASAPAAKADPTTGEFVIVVPGVKPSPQPYSVRTVLEYTS